MQPGEYIIIKLAKLDAALDKEVKLGKMSKRKAKNIKKHLLYLSCKTDLYGIVEDAFEDGTVIGGWENEYAKNVEMNDYLNNLEI